MPQQLTQSISNAIQIEGPFEIVKNYRDIQTKKRRKLLRKLTKIKKITLQRRYLLNLNSQQKPVQSRHQTKIQCNSDEEFNMFFEQSANLPQEDNFMMTNFFSNDFDLKEESDLFSNSTVVSEKHSLYAQGFIKFEFKEFC